MTPAPVTLYGVPHSLYTGRVRSYFVKAGIPHREQAPTTAHYRDVVIPKGGGRLNLPTIEFADGTVIRDGVAIMDHFEGAAGHPFSPSGPKQRVVSRLFDAIGAEGLMRPAMHYRWHFDAQNLDYLRYHFGLLFPAGPEQAQQAEGAANQMRNATRMLGVTPGVEDVVEAVYGELLDALQAHFSAHPYLLGNRPCIGDFGLIAPLFAHLGRDPAPLALMQQRAPALYRWVERMNRPDADLCGFDVEDEGYLADDALPETLAGVLRAFAEDFVPETLGAQAAIQAWLAGQNDLAPGAPVQRAVGMADFEIRGTAFQAIAQPFRFYLLARAQTERDALDEATRRELDALLDATGMRGVFDARLDRAIGREANLEVWL